MHELYVNFMTWLAGAALANSDRLKITIGGAIALVLLKLLALCAFCSTFLTPAEVQAFALYIAGTVITMVVALTSRDVAAPGQTVAGAAVPVALISPPALPAAAPVAPVAAPAAAPAS